VDHFFYGRSFGFVHSRFAAGDVALSSQLSEFSVAVGARNAVVRSRGDRGGQLVKLLCCPSVSLE
jgi:hypothetical protein